MRLNLFTLFVMALLVGCAQSNDDIQPTPQRESLVIGASSVAKTRTAVSDDPDGNGDHSVKWCVGDQVALWADGATDNQSHISGEMFQLNYYGSSYDVAEFSSSLTAAMDDTQNYYYSSFYPCPKVGNIDGKVVSYSIPSTQSGEYDASLDYRVAHSVEPASALSDKILYNAVLDFKSITHALKIRIPEDCNHLGHKVKKLTLTFPVEVTGDMTYDMATKQTSLSNMSKTLVIDLKESMIGEGDYVWAFINPAEGVNGNLVVSAIGEDENGDNAYAKSCTYPISNHSFSAGYFTTIGTEIGEQMPATTIELNITATNLGEPLTQIHFTAPEGVIFNESGSNVASIPTNATKASDTYTVSVSYIPGLCSGYDANSKIGVKYESKHTLFDSDAISMNGLDGDDADKTTTSNRVVPYLLSEDFSTISAFAYKDSPGIGEKWDTDAAEGKDGHDLSESGYGSLATSGWTANRCGAATGKAIRIMGRYEGTTIITFIGGHYEGRMDSPVFSKLKDAAAGESLPTVVVKYDYKNVRYSKYYGVTGYTTGWFGKKKEKKGYVTGGNGTGLYNVGSTVIQGGISGEDDIQSTYFSSYQVMPNTKGGDYKDAGNSNNPGHNVSGKDNPNNFVGGYSEGSFTISNATNKTRASWRVTNDMTNAPTLGANGNFWMYIDNIKIQITE